MMKPVMVLAAVIASGCGACMGGGEDGESEVGVSTISASEFHGGNFSLQWVPGTTVVEASVTVEGASKSTVCAQLGGGKWCADNDKDGTRTLRVRFHQVVGEVDPLHIIVVGNNTIVGAQVLTISPDDNL